MSILELLDHPIAYHRIFSRLTGSVQAALMFSQAVYWQNRATSEDGWWWKTAEQWEDETGLSRREQETARRILRKFMFWKEERRGLPPRMHYFIDGDELRKSLENVNLHKSAKLICTNPPNRNGGKRQINLAESANYSTTEITTETTTTTARGRNPALPTGGGGGGGGGGGFENLHFPNCLSTPQRQAGALKKLAGLDAENAQSLLDAVAWQAGNGGFKTRDGRPGTALRFLEFLRREFDAGRFEESGAIEIRERRSLRQAQGAAQAVARGSVPARSAPCWDSLPESLKPARLRKG